MFGAETRQERIHTVEGWEGKDCVARLNDNNNSNNNKKIEITLESAFAHTRRKDNPVHRNHIPTVTMEQ